VHDYCRREGISAASLIPQTYMVRGDTLEADVKAIVQLKQGSDSFAVPLIVKPGEFSNRGTGIVMAFSPEELMSEAANLIENRKSTSWVVVQEYIARPLLFKNRKFDIRCYALVMKFEDRLLFFWYNDGYARTSSYDYDVNVKDNLKVHLTNEAVQVKGRRL
jgi:tubulin--tyrosine ligase